MKKSLFQIMHRATPLILLSVLLASCASSPVNDRKSEIYLEAGTDFLYNGQYTEALNALLQADKSTPNSPAILNNLGLAYMGKELPAKAEECWKKALSIDPKHSDSRNNLGTLYFRQKKYSLAEATLKEATNDITYTKVSQVYFNLGMLYLEMRRPLQAEQQFLLTIKNNSRHCAGWYQLALLQKEKGDIDDAIQSMKRSVSGTCYRNPEAHYEIASLYLRSKDVENAKSKFLEVIQFFPKSDWAKKAEVTLNMIR